MVPMTWLDDPTPSPAEARRLDAEAERSERAEARRCERAWKCECCDARAEILRLTPHGWMCPNCLRRPVMCDRCGRRFPLAQIREHDGCLYCVGCRGGDVHAADDEEAAA